MSLENATYSEFFQLKRVWTVCEPFCVLAGNLTLKVRIITLHLATFLNVGKSCFVDFQNVFARWVIWYIDDMKRV